MSINDCTLFHTRFNGGKSDRRSNLRRNTSTQHYDQESNVPTVLIAEEDSRFAKALSQGLRAKGFKCTITNDKKEAFPLFLVKRPNVTLLSFHEKEKPDGIKVATDILRTSSRAEIVILADSDSKAVQMEGIGVELFVRRDEPVNKIVDSIGAVSNLKRPTCNLVAK